MGEGPGGVGREGGCEMSILMMVGDVSLPSLVVSALSC